MLIQLVKNMPFHTIVGGKKSFLAMAEGPGHCSKIYLFQQDEQCEEQFGGNAAL